MKRPPWFRWLRPTSSPSAGRTVAANATIVALAYGLSRVLGMVREIVIAARFGTGDTYDAYVAAFRIPDLLFVLIMSGAFGSAFIPVFGGFLARGERERAWRLANTLLTYTVLVLLVVGQFVLIFAEPLIGSVVAPDLPPESQDLAVDLTRLLLLSPLLLGLGAAGRGMLEAYDDFTLPAIAPILYNLGIISGALALAPFFGIYGLVVGVIAGAAGHVLIQFVALLRRGLRLRPSLSRQTEGLGEVARLMTPRVIGQVAGHANLIVMVNFASGLGEGRISALNYGRILVMLPHGILALSLATVIFPRMARQFELERIGELRQTLLRALGPVLFLSIPATILLIAFRVSLVQLVFQYGSFDAESTALVAEAVGYFAIGLVARALIEPLTRAYYAMHDTLTPLIISLLMVAANIALSWWLVPRLGHGGLALSLSITYTARMTILTAILSPRVGGLAKQLASSVPRMIAAMAPATLLAIWIAGPLEQVVESGLSLQSYASVAGACVTVGALYLAASRILRVRELEQLVNAVISRWR